MTAWHVNEGLAPLIAEVAKDFPGIVIGTIGDEEHEHETSDHDPNSAGRVNAADLMLGKAFTEADALALIPFLIVDARTKYLIHDRKIWRSPRGHAASLVGWHTYTEPDPHTNHVHISVWDDAYRHTQPWSLDMNIDDLLDFDDVPNLYSDAKTNPTVTVRTALKAAVSADVKLTVVMNSLTALGSRLSALQADVAALKANQ